MQKIWPPRGSIIPTSYHVLKKFPPVFWDVLCLQDCDCGDLGIQFFDVGLHKKLGYDWHFKIAYPIGRFPIKIAMQRDAEGQMMTGYLWMDWMCLPQDHLDSRLEPGTMPLNTSIGRRVCWKKHVPHSGWMYDRLFDHMKKCLNNIPIDWIQSGIPHFQRDPCEISRRATDWRNPGFGSCPPHRWDQDNFEKWYPYWGHRGKQWLKCRCCNCGLLHVISFMSLSDNLTYGKQPLL
jgi:hypothetical protein